MNIYLIIPIIGFAFVFGCMVGYVWRDDHKK